MKLSPVYLYLFVVFVSVLIYSFHNVRDVIPEVNIQQKSVWALYNPYWGNNITDGSYVGWRRKKMSYMPDYYEPPNSISTVLYPQLGLYSSHDPSLIRQHLYMMFQSGIDGVIIQWNGFNRTDPSTNLTDTYDERAIMLMLDAAEEFNIGVAVQIQLYDRRSNESLYNDINYAFSHFISHPSYLKHDDRPVIFIYDQYETDKLYLTIETLRLEKPKFLVFGTFTTQSQLIIALENDFDGIYTYFASENMNYPSRIDGWPSLQNHTHERGMVFIPTVGPGYSDEKITDWSRESRRSRDNGKHYDRMFKAAIGSNDGIIIINSFNNWLEGTNIEPAIERRGFDFDDYKWVKGGAPDEFLKKTKMWVQLFKNITL